MAFNKVILIGNLTSDPELKATQSGISVCSFSIAVNRPKSKDGEQACDFINIQAWRQTAEFVCKFFKKGKPILVCGRLQTRSYTDNQGNKRTATEVVADEVSFVGNNESTEPKPQTQTYIPSAYTTHQPQFEEVTTDGDLPF
jgi:single-strand DNA-binding protein